MASELDSPRDQAACADGKVENLGQTSALGLLTPSAFWLPESLVESAWYEHAPFGFWIIDVHRPRVLVELGTHHGFSYLSFCQAIDRLGIDTRAYAIDHWRGDEHAGFFGDEVLQVLSGYHNPRYGRFSQLIQSSFDDAAGYFAGGEIDLLHIDGAHRLDSVRNDFETWLPKMSERGVMLFHDINVRRNEFWVWSLWQEIAREYPHFEFDHGHGLGVLGVGSDSPESLDRLFELETTSRGEGIRRAFAELGRSIRHLAELATSQAAAAAALARAAIADSQVDEASRQRTQVESELGLARDQVDHLTRELSALSLAREEAEHRLSALHASHSWRVTAPFRAIGRALRRRST